MMKKGRLNALRKSIQRAIKKKHYRIASLLLERYKSNGGKIKTKEISNG